ncbi:amino acid permease/ SLC12A domain-containing protein [Aspergillus ambiguus]|uniref:amino acid permease/ SLC12A domain-containing protein n=1 Tax=Aspergillus ambiguus TaxID=176160 RepID=UPI003CCDFAA9
MFMKEKSTDYAEPPGGDASIDIEVGPHEDASDPQDSSKSLQRGLKSRHVGMFSIAGAIGTGLIIGSGTALSQGGPGSMFIAYSFVGMLVLNIMSALGEMAVYMPMDKGFSGYASRLVDPAFGFATGMNYYLKYVVLLANNLTASGIIMQYWLPNINVAVWVVSFAVPIIIINFAPVKYFGEVEFGAACIKTITIVGLMILCLVIDLGGSPQGRIGFRYWDNPGAFKEYLVSGSTGRFLGFWASVTNAAFAYMGSEMVGMTFGEASKPWKTIPKAINATFWRISFFYIGGVFCLGLVVSSSSDRLINATKADTGAGASPFVVAIVDSGIAVLPHIINGCLLVFVLSSANTDIYIASRTIYGLSKDGYIPSVFKTTKNSIPVFSVALASIFFLLALLNISSGSTVVFTYLVSLSTILGLLNWVSILVSYLFFQKGMKAQGIRRSVLPFSGKLQEMRATITLFFTGLIIITNGFDSFIHTFDAEDFVVSYVGIVIYIFWIISYKLIRRTQFVGLKTMDITTNTVTKQLVQQIESEN